MLSVAGTNSSPCVVVPFVKRRFPDPRLPDRIAVEDRATGTLNVADALVIASVDAVDPLAIVTTFAVPPAPRPRDAEAAEVIVTAPAVEQVI